MVALSLAFFILDEIIAVIYATITCHVTTGPRIMLRYIGKGFLYIHCFFDGNGLRNLHANLQQ